MHRLRDISPRAAVPAGAICLRPALIGLRSFGRGLAGGLVGGMIGNMLFGGSGHAGAGGVPAGGGGCSSIGLFDLLIIGGLCIWAIAG